MTASISNQTIFHADTEHRGVRIIVVLSLIGGFFLFFVLSQFFLRTIMNETPFILVCGLTIPLTLGFSWVLENILKRVWPSGRSVTVDEDGVRAENKISSDLHLHWRGNLTQLNWMFRMGAYPRSGRERRINSNHYCAAVQLQQGGQHLVVYAFLPPKSGAALLSAESPQFVELDPDEIYETTFRSRFVPPATRPDIPAKVVRGESGRYWLAEKRRWQEGFELAPKDFEQFLQLIEQHRNE